MIISHFKLVRDKIPEIIKKDNAKARFKVLNKEEFRSELFKKLDEEMGELRQAQNSEEMINELVDIYEILDALVDEYELSKQELVTEKLKKKSQRGGFKDRLFLECVEK
jgi:predicted house-cleaning noncanonical NTP pyrophosphatase (MazG superfamily)